MSPFMRSRSVLHPHIFHHKQPQRGPHPAPTSIPIPIVHTGLTPRESQHLKWGMDIQIEDVMLKVEKSRLSWKWAILDMKELELSLDETRFIEEGGEITWNTETGKGWPTEGAEEEEEELHTHDNKEEVIFQESKAKIPMKIFVGTKAVNEVDCNAKDTSKSEIQPEPSIDAQMQTFLHLPLEEFRATMGCEIDHWADEEIKSLQNFFKIPRVERDSTQRARMKANNATVLDTSLTTAFISNPDDQATASSHGDASTLTLVLNALTAAQSVRDESSIHTILVSRLMSSDQDPPTSIEKGELPEPDSISTSIPIYVSPTTYFLGGDDIQTRLSSALIPAPLKLRSSSSSGKGERVPNGPTPNPTSAPSLDVVSCAGSGKGKQTKSASSPITNPQYVGRDIGEGQVLQIETPSIFTSNDQQPTISTLNDKKAVNKAQFEADIKLLDDQIDMQLETFGSVRAGFTETIKLLDSHIPYTEDEKASVQQVFENLGADVIAGHPLVTEDQKAAAQKVLINARARLIADMSLLPASMILNSSQGAGEENEAGLALIPSSDDQALADSRLKEIFEEKLRLVKVFAEAEYRTRRIDLRIRAERARLPASQPESSASQKATNPGSFPGALDSPITSCTVPSLAPNKGGQSQTGTTTASISIDQAPANSSSTLATETPKFTAETAEQRVITEAKHRKKRLQVQYRAERETVLGHSIEYTDVAAIRDAIVKHGYPAPDIGIAYVGTKIQQPGDEPHVCQHGCRSADLMAERHLSQIIDGKSAVSPRHGPGHMTKLDLFGDIYPPQRHLADISYDTKPVKTDEEAAAEMEEDVALFRQAMLHRKKGVEQVYHEARRSHGLKFDGWKKEDAGLEAEINLRAEQYHHILIASRRFEKGETNLPGLGPEVQKDLTFMDCDEAEQIRRAGHARKIREEYYAELDRTQIPYDANDFMEAELRAFMYTPEEDPEMAEYHEEYEAAVAAGFVPAEAGTPGFYGTTLSAPPKPHACSGAGSHGRHGVMNDSVEDQIRRRQEAREKQEADRKKMIAERELAKELNVTKDAVTRGGGGKKSQKKGKGRKHKK